MLALARGLGAVFGIIGSLIYPKLRSAVGLQRCGLIAYALDLSCLSFAVVSIFLPGSPFDPTFIFSAQHPNASEYQTTVNNTTVFIDKEYSIHSKCSIATFVFSLIVVRCGERLIVFLCKMNNSTKTLIKIIIILYYLIAIFVDL